MFMRIFGFWAANSISTSGLATKPRDERTALDGVKGLGGAPVFAGSKIAGPPRGERLLLGSLKRVALNALRSPVRRCLEAALAFVLRHRDWMPAFLAVLSYFPSLEARLLRFAKARYSREDVALPGQSLWMIEPEPAALSAWTELLSQQR